jgi:hypothetical protein
LHGFSPCGLQGIFYERIVESAAKLPYNENRSGLYGMEPIINWGLIGMLYELRIYSMHPGRLDAIHGRFSNHTLSIFNRLGMKVCDFWADANGNSKLYYVMEFSDMDERNRLWDTFRADPEWIEAKRKSEESGPIVEKVEEIFMDRADYFIR